MNVLFDVVQTALQYGPDVQFRVVCPFCDGGSSGERSMGAVLTQRRVAYKCHRANCGIGGYITVQGEHGETVKIPPRSPERKMNLIPIGTTDAAVISERWNILQDDLTQYGWKYDTCSDRIALPVRAPNGTIRGIVLRALYSQIKPKVLSVKLVDDEPFCAWVRPLTVQRYVPVVVEDIPSATRVAMTGGIGVALLGTHMPDDVKNEIMHNGEIVLALDEDASQKALDYQRELSLRGKVRVLLLEKDIKDMTEKEAVDCLQNVI